MTGGCLGEDGPEMYVIPAADGFVHGNCAFTIDMLEATVAILEERLDMVRAYLTTPDIGYGLSPIGVVNLLNLVNGDDVG